MTFHIMDKGIFAESEIVRKDVTILCLNQWEISVNNVTIAYI